MFAETVDHSDAICFALSIPISQLRVEKTTNLIQNETKDKDVAAATVSLFLGSGSSETTNVVAKVISYALFEFLESFPF